MKPMSYDDYLRLTGLLTLAADHRKALDAIERSACAITGDRPEDSGHTSDAVWGGRDSTAAELLRLLGIPVPAQPVPSIEDGIRQMGNAMELIQRARRLGPGPGEEPTE